MSLPILDGNQSATTLSTILSGGEHTPAHTVVSLGSTAISNITSAVSGSVVSVSNFPSTQTIAGTVTVGNSVTIGAILSSQNQNIVGTSGVFSTLRIKDNAGTYGEPQGSGTLTYNLPVYGTVTVGNSVTIGSLPAISGTVTANVLNATISYVSAVLDGDGNTFGIDRDFPISGTVAVGNSVTIGNTVTVAGTVTVGAMPNGSLTTRFGTPTTANTAFATSAVTNTSRKYLLIQNVTTGSNVITVGIGFTPTTTQGIQLTAGAGITFESSYIPTGAVMILSSVTASNYTILEA